MGVQEFPTIRFRVAKPGEDASTGLEARSLVAQRVAVDLNERLSIMQRAGQLPASSTCDLVIFDRWAVLMSHTLYGIALCYLVPCCGSFQTCESATLSSLFS